MGGVPVLSRGLLQIFHIFVCNFPGTFLQTNVQKILKSGSRSSSACNALKFPSRAISHARGPLRVSRFARRTTEKKRDCSSSNFFRRILRSEGLVYKSYIFFSEQPFYGNYSTLDSHTNTVISVISHAFAHSSRWRRKP